MSATSPLEPTPKPPFAPAPYQLRPYLSKRAYRAHPAQPLVWAAVLIFVPIFWMTVLVWSAQVVF